MDDPATNAPPAPGDMLPGGWRVTSLTARHGRLRVALVRGEARAEVGFAPIEPGEDPGPLGRDGVRCWLQGREGAIEAVREAAAAVLARLGEGAPAERLRGWLQALTVVARDRGRSTAIDPAALGLPALGERVGSFELRGVTAREHGRPTACTGRRDARAALVGGR